MSKNYEKDSLGKRMKDYEMRSRSYLPRRTNYIIRIDGKAFHSYTKKLNKPFDIGLMEDMAETTLYLCNNIQGCKFGYTQSDEISLLITDYDNLKTNAWFDGQVQKIVSVASSMATAKFNQLRYIRKMSNVSSIDNIVEIIKNTKLGEFDARVYSISEKEEVINYFIWRQQDASRNSISMLAQANFSHNLLMNKNTNQMQDLLFTEKEINWNDCLTVEKRGWAILRKNECWFKLTKNTKPILYNEGDILPENAIVFNRQMFGIDVDMPIISKDRMYILNCF